MNLAQRRKGVEKVSIRGRRRLSTLAARLAALACLLAAVSETADAGGVRQRGRPAGWRGSVAVGLAFDAADADGKAIAFSTIRTIDATGRLLAETAMAGEEASSGLHEGWLGTAIIPGVGNAAVQTNAQFSVSFSPPAR
jgi:hypothetical protein